ncbi:ABC transporter permease [Pseudodesulfovibrio piezophilus]|uniref:Putative ABC transporter, permease protein n=1 Tax=Pseudodesulfovibrio piezophilus (strain DSM 21447 / JCM 15486 / C1TLV30) TaxID=1322246 RepID=M1WMT2_PSEP2|nr:ABC transporter permease subunit [Pseudodesulfovibrio piezophilus]CCH49945.1 putative ABC transporter, permease protein [Pseudodesulfovibrio piezophilus C1TLV30]
MSSGKSLHPVSGRTLTKLSSLLIPFMVLFLGGLTLALVQSLGYWVPIPPEGGMFAAYGELVRPHIIDAAIHSIWVALISMVLAVSIGAILASLIWLLPSTLERMSIVYKIPLILPHIAVAFIVLIFWSQSGVIASIGNLLGLVETPQDFPSLIHGGSGAGMILAYVYKEIPFVIILAHAVLKRLDPRLVQTASMLGAGPMTIFFKIMLPHMRPALNTASIILFLYAFGAFDIPYLLSESSPSMLSIEAFNLYFRRDLSNRPQAMALLICMFLFSLAFIVIYTRLAARLSAKDRKL